MAWIPLAAAGIGAAASIIGSDKTNQTNETIANNANTFSAAQAKRQMDFQAEQVQEQERYQTEMSNTQYQRATADMKAAGLNPMLGYSQGGAGTPSVSAPSGAMASATVPTITNPYRDASRDIATAAQVALTLAQKDKTIADTDLTRATIPKVAQDTATSAENAKAIIQNVAESKQRVNESVQRVQNLATENSRLQAATDLIMNEVTLTGTRIENVTEATALIKKQIQLMGVDTTLRQLLIPEKANDAEIASGTWGKLVSALRMLITPAANAIGSASRAVK